MPLCPMSEGGFKAEVSITGPLRGTLSELRKLPESAVQTW